MISRINPSSSTPGSLFAGSLLVNSLFEFLNFLRYSVVLPSHRCQSDQLHAYGFSLPYQAPVSPKQLVGHRRAMHVLSQRGDILNSCFLSHAFLVHQRQLSITSRGCLRHLGYYLHHLYAISHFAYHVRNFCLPHVSLITLSLAVRGA